MEQSCRGGEVQSELFTLLCLQHLLELRNVDLNDTENVVWLSSLGAACGDKRPELVRLLKARLADVDTSELVDVRLLSTQPDAPQTFSFVDWKRFNDQAKEQQSDEELQAAITAIVAAVPTLFKQLLLRIVPNVDNHVAASDVLKVYFAVFSTQAVNDPMVAVAVLSAEALAKAKAKRDT